jgi:hypothetical protein
MLVANERVQRPSRKILILVVSLTGGIVLSVGLPICFSCLGGDVFVYLALGSVFLLLPLVLAFVCGAVTLWIKRRCYDGFLLLGLGCLSLLFSLTSFYLFGLETRRLFETGIHAKAATPVPEVKR